MTALILSWGLALWACVLAAFSITLAVLATKFHRQMRQTLTRLEVETAKALNAQAREMAQALEALAKTFPMMETIGALHDRLPIDIPVHLPEYGVSVTRLATVDDPSESPSDPSRSKDHQE